MTDESSTRPARNSTAPKPITVTVKPQLPKGKNVPCQLSGGGVENNTIWLDADQDYDITFVLTGANGVNGWHGTLPFGNDSSGDCPPAGQGPCGRFSLKSGAAPGSIKISVASGGRFATNYRLNFNDDYTCDPIIVVG